MDNICNGYSRSNDSERVRCRKPSRKETRQFADDEEKEMVSLCDEWKERNDGRDGRMTKESTSETETKLFAKPFARLPTRRSFIVSLFSSKYILFRETRSLARLSISLPRKLRCRNVAMTSGMKYNLCIYNL